jgi:hypothetical protein
MPVNEIKLKIQIDNKEAIASLQLTDENIKDLYKSFKYGKQEVNGLTTQMSMGFNNAREILGGVREAYQAITSLFRQPIQAQVELEQAQVSFKVLFGSVELADQRIKELYKFTATTPFQLNEVITASRQLEVLTKGALSSGAGLRMVGDVASGVGVPINELSMWFGRLYDGIQSGRPVGEALMRLQELGVLSGDVRSEIETLSKAGAENAEVWDVVTEAMSKFSGMMEEQSDTLGGKLSNLEDNITQIQTTIGGTIATGLSPFLGHINSITSSLNENYPFMVGLVGITGALGAAMVILNTTGIMPVIKSLLFKKAVLEDGIIATARQASANAGLTASNISLAASARGAAAGIKSIFASIGPVGWAIIGITALVEVLGLLNDEVDETTQKVDELNTLSLENLREEKALLDLKLVMDSERINNIKKEIDAEEKPYISLRQELQRLENGIYLTKTKQFELITEIEKKEKLIEASVKSQYESLKKKIELEAAVNDKERNIIKLKQTYESDVANLREALQLKIIDSIQFEKDLTELTRNYNKQRTEELKKLPKVVVGLYSEIDGKIKELNNQKATAKTISEIIAIDKKINELTKEKKYIEFQVEVATSDKYKIDADKIQLAGEVKANSKTETKAGTPKTLQSKETISQYQELQDMRLDVMEDGYLKEEAIRNANHQADLAAYRDVVGAKEIIDRYYRKQKEKQDEASAMASIQTSMNALNFIAAAVNQYTVVGKAIAVAQATWNTYQAATAALGAQPWGPWNIALAAMVTAAGLANVAKIVGAEPPKMQGFYMGGRFRKGEAGYIEGIHNEIIAPEKTFIEVFERELRPQIYAGSATYNSSIQNNTELIKEFRETKSAIQKLSDGGLTAFISEKNFNKSVRNADSRRRKSRV